MQRNISVCVYTVGVYMVEDCAAALVHHESDELPLKKHSGLILMQTFYASNQIGPMHLFVLIVLLVFPDVPDDCLQTVFANEGSLSGTVHSIQAVLATATTEVKSSYLYCDRGRRPITTVRLRKRAENQRGVNSTPSTLHSILSHKGGSTGQFSNRNSGNSGNLWPLERPG